MYDRRVGICWDDVLYKLKVFCQYLPVEAIENQEALRIIMQSRFERVPFQSWVLLFCIYPLGTNEYVLITDWLLSKTKKKKEEYIVSRNN